jgi:hypothetical protein
MHRQIISGDILPYRQGIAFSHDRYASFSTSHAQFRAWLLLTVEQEPLRQKGDRLLERLFYRIIC